MPTTVTANINYYRTLIGVERIFILTGPNRGGKTILEQALGISRVTFRRRCDTENLTVSDLRIIADKLHIKVIDLMKGV